MNIFKSKFNHLAPVFFFFFQYGLKTGIQKYNVWIGNFEKGIQF